VVDQWGKGKVAEQLDSIRGITPSTDMYNSAGELQQQNPTFGVRPGEGYLVNRAEAVDIFYQHAKSLGLDLRFGILVSEYWETEDQAGVMANEERIVGDCVIACDGIHSKAREIITRDSTRPLKTGSATYRASFRSDCVGNDPDAQWLLDGRGKTDKLNYFIGENVLIIIGTLKCGEEIFWSCVHKVTLFVFIYSA
jgi:2-polyprenyl-6-methoxyphenol hydroxylase-like FAD-dependent oxidoreductase